MKFLTKKEIYTSKINFKVDHTKKEYEDFKIISYYGWTKETNGKKYPAYNATCKHCGTQVILPIVYLSKGKTTLKSCGCSKKKLKSEDYFDQTIGTPAFNKLYRSYQRKAEKSGLPFTFSIETFYKIVQQDCYYCGEPAKQIFSTRSGREFLYNGLDRKDNSLGYTTGNTVTCCGMCNHMKWIYPHDKFIKKIYAISKHIAVPI